MNRLLLATLGLSPGVVTSAFFKLRREGLPIKKVVTVSTVGPATRQVEDMVWETLEASEFRPEYRPLRAVKASDLGNSQVTHQFMEYMRKRLEEYGRDHEIDLVLTGGRTSMAAAAMLAVQQATFHDPKLAARLRLYHLEVLDPDLEPQGHIARLKGMKPEDRALYLDPVDSKIALVQIPILSLKEEPNDLRARLFEYAVGAHLMEKHDFQQVRYSFKPAYLNQKGLGEIDVYAEKSRPGAIEAVEELDRPTFRNMLLQAFNRNELETLCYDLNIDPETFENRGLEGMVRDLLLYAERHGRLTDLLQACVANRPLYPWRDAANLRQALLCECKLRTGDDPAAKPVAIKEIRRLANKVEAEKQENGRRQVVGWLVSNAPAIDDDARALALEKGISVFQALLPANWKERVDWRIEKDLIPLQQPSTL
ncbi:MAG: hypothetical protein IAE79_13750 [Anaerolinea sp.]|nr:hypothetical protein [Anaerolinea sp.]